MKHHRIVHAAAVVFSLLAVTVDAQTLPRPASNSIISSTARIASSLSASPAQMDASNPPAAVAPSAANNGKKPIFTGRDAPAKPRKAPIAAGGTWKWTSFNRNGQPCENVLTLTVGKNGKVTGRLLDQRGEHEVKDATLGDGVVTFALKFHTRGEGDLPHTYTVNLDPDDLQVSVDRPDLTPFGKSHGGKYHSDHTAKHDPNG